MERDIIYSRHSCKSSKRFALIALLLREGIELEKISWIVGVSKRQVYNYRKAYQSQGDGALAADTRYKPASELEAYKDIIKADITANQVATASEASERILSLTGIKRSPMQIRTFMHRLGLKPLKVVAILAKANPAAQAEFFEGALTPRIEDAVAGKRTLLFMDAAHFVWQLYAGVLRCVNRIFILAASGRTRINVLGAYDPIRNELIKRINRSYINSFEAIKLLEQMKTIYLDQAITIVLDNAKYQRCNVVREKARALHIELLFLPSRRSRRRRLPSCKAR